MAVPTREQKISELKRAGRSEKYIAHYMIGWDAAGRRIHRKKETASVAKN